MQKWPSAWRRSRGAWRQFSSKLTERFARCSTHLWLIQLQAGQSHARLPDAILRSQTVLTVSRGSRPQCAVPRLRQKKPARADAVCAPAVLRLLPRLGLHVSGTVVAPRSTAPRSGHLEFASALLPQPPPCEWLVPAPDARV